MSKLSNVMFFFLRRQSQFFSRAGESQAPDPEAMNNHLSPEEFVDAIEGALPSYRLAHLDQCEACRREAGALGTLARQVDAVTEVLREVVAAERLEEHPAVVVVLAGGDDERTLDRQGLDPHQGPVLPRVRQVWM